MFDFRPNECDKHMQIFESVCFFNVFLCYHFPKKAKSKIKQNGNQNNIFIDD
jgi:hypothetical protein